MSRSFELSTITRRMRRLKVLPTPLILFLICCAFRAVRLSVVGWDYERLRAYSGVPLMIICCHEQRARRGVHYIIRCDVVRVGPTHMRSERTIIDKEELRVKNVQRDHHLMLMSSRRSGFPKSGREDAWNHYWKNLVGKLQVTVPSCRLATWICTGSFDMTSLSVRVFKEAYGHPPVQTR